MCLRETGIMESHLIGRKDTIATSQELWEWRIESSISVGQRKSWHLQVLGEQCEPVASEYAIFFTDESKLKIENKQIVSPAVICQEEMINRTFWSLSETEQTPYLNPADLKFFERRASDFRSYLQSVALRCLIKAVVFNIERLTAQLQWPYQRGYVCAGTC